MLYKNAYYFSRELRFVHGSFRVDQGRFSEILDYVPDEPGLDLKHALVIPGLVDIHIHGAVGADFSDGSLEGLEKISRYLAQNGVTSFAPTSMTLPFPCLLKACETALQLCKNRPSCCARLAGIHLEGPFLSLKKSGAQNSAYLQPPDVSSFKQLFESCEGIIQIVDIAPELSGSDEFIRTVSRQCTVSLAHTDASYDEAKAAFSAGASHITHLFNCMPAIHHRMPGVIGAASETCHILAELICDGFHIHPSAVRMAFKLFPHRICLVSDALRCCGMADGNYTLGGQPITLQGGVARLNDGTIAGSATNLFDCLKTAIRIGIPKEDAIAAATLLPAQAVGVADQIGSFDVGKHADFLLCDESFSLQAVYLGGEKL